MGNSSFSRAVSAEILKLRSTVALKLALIYPIIPVFIYGLIMFYFQEKIADNKMNTWAFFISIVWNFWSSFAFLPLIGLQTILINNLENANNGWRNLFSLAFSRNKIYLAKLLTVIFLILISLVSLSFYIYLYGIICSVAFPQLNFQNHSIPLTLFVNPLLVLVGSLAIICLHYFFSAFVKNVFTCFGATVFVTILGLFLIQKEDIAIYFPWSWPALSSHSFNNGMNASQLGEKSLALSLLFFLIITVIGLRNESKWNKISQ